MLRQSRPVDFQTKISIFRQRPVLIVLSGLLTTLGLAFLIGFMFIIPSLEEGMPDANYDKVNANGITTQATITDIEVQGNVSVNNEHPSIITYSYTVGSETVEDRFRTLAPQKVSQLQIGDEIKIKYLNSESIIPTLDPFKFPFWIFGLFSIPMLLVGITSLILLIIHTQKQLKLYQYGTIREATLISFTQPDFSRTKHLHVHYQYTTSLGQTVMGKSRTNDYTLMSQSKYGDAIKIFVSPENEQHSCIVPNLEATRNGWQV
jgi:hypothetical protein